MRQKFPPRFQSFLASSVTSGDKVQTGRNLTRKLFPHDGQSNHIPIFKCSFSFNSQDNEWTKLPNQQGSVQLNENYLVTFVPLHFTALVDANLFRGCFDSNTLGNCDLCRNIEAYVAVFGMMSKDTELLDCLRSFRKADPDGRHFSPRLLRRVFPQEQLPRSSRRPSIAAMF